jgi:hypothetical protein
MAAALLLGSVSATASPLGEPGGGGGEDEGIVDADLILAAGATAVVVGLIVYDILSDSAREEAAADTASASVEDTGIDWSSVEVSTGDTTPSDEEDEEETAALTVVIEAFPGSGGTAAAAEIADGLGLLLAGTRFDVRPSPVSIGSGYTPEEKARMASDFFSSDVFVSMEPADDGTWRVAVLDDAGDELAAAPMTDPTAQGVRELIAEAFTE